MFKLIKQETLKNLDIELFEFEHEKTKARHIHLKADDDENSFVCGFKTMADSDNGVKHILEHSVLQGSRDFPLKDSFTSILKQSLQTYMNAATSTDHTYYLYSTQNVKDYFNLMHVYTNSAFFPLMRKETFLQEGWRYEFAEPKNPNSELTVNGVVFNEMKGARATPSSKLWQAMFESLYPDTKFAFESGGLPKNIPDLSYEEFCDYHKKYYHPSNAIFLTYGDIPYTQIQEKLEDLVLKEFDYQEVIVQNPIQKPFETPKDVTIEFAYEEDDFNEQHFYLKMYHITDVTNPNDSFTMDFAGALMSSGSDSIMLKALEDSNLFTSPICFSTENGRDVFLLIGGQGIDLANTSKVDELVNKTLQEIVKNGFSDKKIATELHSYELDQRTKSNGHSNYGLNLLTTVMGGAIYNVDPKTFLKPEDALENLKLSLEKDPSFIQKFIEDKVINNSHSVNLTFKASKQAAIDEQEAFQTKIKNIENSLTDEDKQNILNDFIALEAYQAEEDSDNILPELSVSDIPLKKEFQELKTKEYKNTKVFAFDVATNGLTYVNKTSFVKDIKASDVKYLTVYSALIGMLGYGDKSYGQANEEISSVCGGISFSTSITEDRYNPEKIYLRTSFSSKMLNKNKAKVKTLMDTIVNNRRFDEKERIVNKLKEMSHHLQAGLVNINSGINTAKQLANASFSEIDTISLYNGGILYIKFIKELVGKLDDETEYNNLINKLVEIDNKVKQSYQKSVLAVIDTPDELENTIETFFDESIISDAPRYTIDFDLEKVDAQAFLSDKTNTNYCVMSQKAPYLDHELAGAYSVLGKIITGEYLHIEIREKGGAYGGGASYKPSSETFTMASWYDPNISKTFQVYKNLKTWLEDESNINQKIIDEGILQTIGGFDKPALPVSKCATALNNYFDEVTNDDLESFREKILKTDMHQIRRVINELLIPGLATASCAVFANKNQFNKEKIELKVLDF
jgi:presequence protease